MQKGPNWNRPLTLVPSIRNKIALWLAHNQSKFEDYGANLLLQYIISPDHDKMDLETFYLDLVCNESKIHFVANLITVFEVLYIDLYIRLCSTRFEESLLLAEQCLDRRRRRLEIVDVS